MIKAILAVLVAAFLSKAAFAQIPPIVGYTPGAPVIVKEVRKEYRDPNGALYCSIEQVANSFQVTRFSAPDITLVNATTIKSCLEKLPKRFKVEKVQDISPAARRSDFIHYGPLNCQVIKPFLGPSRYELRFAVMATVKDSMIRECFTRIGPDPLDTPNSPSNWDKSA